MQDIPPGFYTWAGPVGVAALIVIIVMAVKGWTRIGPLGRRSVRNKSAAATETRPHNLRGHVRRNVLRPHLLSLADERVPEEKARLILVVRAAAELNVVRRCCASHRVRRDVVELKEPSLATAARPSDKRTASRIALPHFTPDSGRYVTS